MSQTDFITPGNEFIKAAMSADAEGDKILAFEFFMKGIEYLTFGLKYEKIPQRQNVLRKRLKEYITRAEVLKGEMARGVVDSPRPSTSATRASEERGSVEDSERWSGLEANTLKRPEDSNSHVKWSDIAGLDAAKQTLQEAAILPLRLPHLFGEEPGKRKPWTSILFYGPPGTGKTQLARAVATEVQCAFFNVTASSLVSKWIGESEKALRDLFAMAKEKQPAVIFIDEIDSLCGQRDQNGESESSRRLKNEFLTQTNSMEGILLLAATNLPWSLDEAFIRRFKKRIYIPLPDTATRAVMLRLHLQGKEHRLTEEEIQDLAEKTEGFSGSDIAQLADEAHMEPIRHLTRATHFKIAEDSRMFPCDPADPEAWLMGWNDVPDTRNIYPHPTTSSDFLRAAKTVKPTVSQSGLDAYTKWTAQVGENGA